MYCGRCGVYNDDSHAYCENCGNRLAGETVGHAAAPPSAAATATGCSYSLSQGIAFADHDSGRGFLGTYL